MNTFTMTCQHCDKTFTLTTTNRTNWSKGACDTCIFEKRLDHNAKMSICITQKGWQA